MQSYISKWGHAIIIGLSYLYFPQNNQMSVQPPPQKTHITSIPSPSSPLPADKPPSHPPSPLPHTDIDHPSTAIQVFLRCPSKKSIKLHLPNEVAVQHLKRAASDKLGIPSSQQILKLNGKDITHYTHILLHPHSIIHLATRNALLTVGESTNLKVNIISSFNGSTPAQRMCAVGGQERVEDFMGRLQEELTQTLQPNGEVPFFFLLQSSRLLDRNQSFSQQEVPRDTELICLITKHEVKTRFHNDTSEDILSDISALLQLDTITPLSDQPSQQSPVSHHNLREDSSARSQVYEVDTPGQDYQRTRRQSLWEQQQQREVNSNIAPFDHSNSFKKKATEQPPPSQAKTPFLKTIRARRSKKELDELLKKQGIDNIFYKEDTTTSPKKESQRAKITPIEQGQQQISMHKPSTTIPKVMPFEQRRKIKLQMERLFDLGRSTLSSAAPSSSIQEQQPKSPPTEPPRIQKRREKMAQLRQTMGARPTFLNNLFTTNKPQQN